jgi:hypothetical protein
VLSSAERDRRPPRSLRAEYEEFIYQRIEEYKDTLPREKILAIGDEAVVELQRAEQYQLTEILLREQVDAIIRRRLKLPSFRRWRERHLALRAAQAHPGHWGLASTDPIVALADLVEDLDPVLAVGAADGACALFLAARGAQVLVVDPDIAAVEGLENRAKAEALGQRLECLVTSLERYAPEHEAFVACVIELQSLQEVSTVQRTELIRRLKDATPPGGRHVVMPQAGERAAGGPRLSCDALRPLYAGWAVPRTPSGGSASARTSRNSGFMAVRPGASD